MTSYTRCFVKLTVSLVLITEQSNNIRVFRRLHTFEKVLTQLQRKPVGILYYYQLNDFRQRRHVQGRVERKILEQRLDQKFEHIGRLEKKNQKGVYVETNGYLNQTYFGFYNMNKRKIKLFKLEYLQMYIWDDGCENSFKIVTQKKIYFFRTQKESQFKIWLHQLEKRLDSSRHRLYLLKMERCILDNNLTLVNLMDEHVQLATRVPEYRAMNHFDPFAQYVLANSRSPLDVNLLKWAMLANRVLDGDIDSQVLKTLGHSWDQIALDYQNHQFKDRFPEPSARERRKPLRDLVEFHDFGAMIDEVQTIKSTWRADKDINATKLAITKLVEQIYLITHRKYVWQYQLIIKNRVLVQQAKKNFMKHTKFKVPDFEFFWN